MRLKKFFLLFLLLSFTFIIFIRNSNGEELTDLLSNPLFFENLANPKLSTEKDIENKAIENQLLLLGLLELIKEKSHYSKLGEEINLALSLISRFLDFSGQGLIGDTQRETVLLDDCLFLNFPPGLRKDIKKEIINTAGKSYKEILKKWNSEIDVPIPAGFIFIKFFIVPETMHSQYDLKPETRGVAFPCRYVAILLTFDSKDFLVREALKNTLSHELSHIFCYVTLGLQKISKLPTWFHEGVALELSGERRISHITQDYNQVNILTIISTEEYKKYKRNFQFIKEKYGEDKLYEFIRESLLRGHTTGYSLDLLSSQSESWFKEKRNFEFFMILIIFGLVIIIKLKLKRKKNKKRFYLAATLGGLFLGSLTPYYYHSSGKSIFGTIMVGMSLLVINKNIRLLVKGNALFKEAENYEFSKNYLQSIILFREFLKLSKDHAFLGFVKKKKTGFALEKIKKLENKFFNQYMKKANEFEQRKEYSEAMECCQKIYNNIFYLKDRRRMAEKNIQKIKLLIYTLSQLPEEEDDDDDD